MVRAGAIGAVLAAICCAAPLLAAGLSLAGLGAWLAGAGLIIAGWASWHGSSTVAMRGPPAAR